MRYKVKELREKRGMTQHELAEKSGISRVIISKMEQEKSTTTLTKTLVKVASALNVSVSSLFLKE